MHATYLEIGHFLIFKEFQIKKKCHKFEGIKPLDRMMMTQISWLQYVSRDEFFLACLRVCVYEHVIVNAILNLGIIEGIQE